MNLFLSASIINFASDKLFQTAEVRKLKVCTQVKSSEVQLEIIYNNCSFYSSESLRPKYCLPEKSLRVRKFVNERYFVGNFARLRRARIYSEESRRRKLFEKKKKFCASEICLCESLSGGKFTTGIVWNVESFVRAKVRDENYFEK